MNTELKDLISQHVQDAKTKIANLPHQNLKGFMKMQGYSQQLTAVEKIINEEMDTLLDYVNENLVPNWSDEQREESLQEMRRQFKELYQFGARKILVQ